LWWKLTALALPGGPILVANCESWVNRNFSIFSGKIAEKGINIWSWAAPYFIEGKQCSVYPMSLVLAEVAMRADAFQKSWSIRMLQILVALQFLWPYGPNVSLQDST
jgi:hypothetical protein